MFTGNSKLEVTPWGHRRLRVYIPLARHCSVSISAQSASNGCHRNLHRGSRSHRRPAAMLCVHAAADSTITNLFTRGKIYVFDKPLGNGKTVTLAPSQLSNVKLSRELNGASGTLPLKDRRQYLIVNNRGDAAFPSDFMEARFITSAF